MKRVTYVMLILALCGLAIYSCKKIKTSSAEAAENTAELRNRVKKQIKDKIRRDNVLILVDDVDRLRSKVTLAWLDMQNQTQKNPSMTREEVEAELEKFEELRLNALTDMAKARLAMRKYITVEEWTKLFAEKKKKEKEAAEKEAKERSKAS